MMGIYSINIFDCNITRVMFVTDTNDADAIEKKCTRLHVAYLCTAVVDG